MGKEIRVFFAEMEVRAADDGKRTITGYAVKWDQLSEKMGWFQRFREKFQRGSFADSLTNDDQYMHWNHNDDIVLARKKNGTLRLEEDDTGLRFEADMPSNQWGDYAYEAVQRGDVDKMSFGFKMQGEEWDDNDEDNVVRTVTKAQLFEVSPVPYPAFPQSEAQARSIDKVYEDYRAANEPEPVTTEPDLAEQLRGFHKVKSKIYQVYEEVARNG